MKSSILSRSTLLWTTCSSAQKRARLLPSVATETTYARMESSSSGTVVMRARLVQCGAYDIRQGEDEGDAMIKVADYISSRHHESAPGVYAIYDSNRNLQYIGWADDMFAQIKAHTEAISEDQCIFIRAKVFANASMATEETMRREAEHWMEDEGGVVPPGNGIDAKLWGNQLLESESEDESAKPSTVVSPFSHAQVHRTVGEHHSDANQMTVESVDKALNEVRPYLIADGGDVEVVKVEEGIVYLRFQGACTTCSSQSTTMSMGIERALKGAFPESFERVEQLDKQEPGPPPGATREAVDSLLDLLRPAVQNYGGKVVVRAVERGVCSVEYDGPEPIWIGVRSAIRDKFPDIKEVVKA